MKIEDGTFTWGNTEEDHAVLTDINLTVKAGSLVAVVGTVGSGKTSLCCSILGDMEKTKGQVNVAVSVTGRVNTLRIVFNEYTYTSDSHRKMLAWLQKEFGF